MIRCKHTLISMFISRYSIKVKTKNIEISNCNSYTHNFINLLTYRSKTAIINENISMYENMLIIRKIIFEGYNNFMQNKCNKWMKKKNVLPNHKDVNMESSAIHLHV